MAIINNNTWDASQRPWGYQIRVDFTDDVGHIYNEMLVFPSEPTGEELTTAIAKLQSRVEQRIIDEIAEAAKPRINYEEQYQILTQQVNTLTAENESLNATVIDLQGQLEVMRGGG